MQMKRALSADDAELAALDQEYAQLAAQDAGLTDGLHQRQQKQQRKGAAVANQCRVWENALQLRIMLQRCLQAAHQLPPAALQPICCAADSGVATAYSEVSQAASSTLDSLLELQAALIGQHPAAAEAVAAAAAAAPPSQGTGLPNGHAPEANGTAPLANGTAGRKHGREAAAPENDQGNEGSVPERKWQRIDEAYRLLAPFRDASVDRAALLNKHEHSSGLQVMHRHVCRWHRKTMLASGGIVSRGNLRALNQSVSSQVAALLRSSDKAVQRTALSGTDRPRVLCAPGHWQAPAASAAEQPLQQAVEAGVATATAPTGAVEPNNETFDDAEFYAQLLKEFLEATGSAGPGLVHTAQGINSIAWAGLVHCFQRGSVAQHNALRDHSCLALCTLLQGRKRRKQVDRRASKGRKLRFHVQDKLVSFMSPVEAAADAMAPKLFRNLFGIKA
eukprot:jgi/Astpho2/9292/Aster-06865